MCGAAVDDSEVRRKTSEGEAGSFGRKASEGEGDAPVCWICHEGEADGRALASPCRCRALTAHASCAARWQLQSAGRAEERFCRFCAAELPDWRDTHAHLPKAPPVSLSASLPVEAENSQLTNHSPTRNKNCRS